MTPSFSTLIDLFAYNAEAYPNHAAVIVDDNAHSHTALYWAVQRQAAALSAMGVKRGDRVLVVAGNRPEVLVLLGAAAWLGAMLVPLNLRLSEAEMAQQARDAAPMVVIVDAACDALWNAAWPKGMPNVSRMDLETPAWPSLACAGPNAAAHVPRQDEPDLGALMLYTAAVEGHARGAVLAQSHLTASAQQIARVWSLNADDRWLGVLPLFHAAGIGLSLVLLSVGGACVLLPRFDPSAAVAAVAQHHVTVCATFSPMLTAMLDAAQASGTSLASLRVAMGMEPPAAVERLIASSPGMAFWSAYGQAEVSSMVCLGLQSERPGAAGRAVEPSQVRIQDAAGQPVPIDVEGEIAVCGPTVFLGYWDVAQQRPFKPAGPWHRTGDLGRLDADGWLWFVGRAPHKQLIKTGGENVYPAEVEQVLLEHPAVAEAFVFGQPDEKWGEAVHAICALKPGTRATADELIGFVESRLARYKRPKTVKVMDPPLERHNRRL
jgi:acyl-CoA synthetase (AMP-forming)/AMP-acid ligase II